MKKLTQHEIKSMLHDLSAGRISPDTAYHMIHQETERRELFWFAFSATVLCIGGIALILMAV